MNQKQLMLKRQESKRKLEQTSRSHWNCIRLNSGNTLTHEQAKFDICSKLLDEGIQFVTEAIFQKGRHRADIYVLDLDVAIEVYFTENPTISQAAKAHSYPCRIVFHKAGTQFRLEELY